MTNPTINSNLKFLNKDKQNDDTMEQADIKAQQIRCSSLVTLPVEAMPKTTTSRPPLLALPDEIKLMVLSEYLPYNKFFVRPDLEGNQLHTFDFAKQVLPLLMAIPKLKYLVYDVLLKQNKILITTSPRGGIPYPPGWINALIPRLCVRIHMTENGIRFLPASDGEAWVQEARRYRYQTYGRKDESHLDGAYTPNTSVQRASSTACRSGLKEYGVYRIPFQDHLSILRIC